MNKENNITNLFIGAILISFCAGVLLVSKCTPNKVTADKQQVTNTTIIVHSPCIDTNAVDIKILYKELVNLGVKFPEIVVAQALLETGHFTSEYYKVRHNLFGFRTKEGYMYFGSWKACCKYYKRWQDKHFLYKYGDYYSFLDKIHYAEDPQYTRKLKKIVTNGF